jgi:eukaryotic-like serine/threonine-protein kinase
MNPHHAKKCGACGREFGASASFCPYDGQPLGDAPTPEVGSADLHASGLSPGRVIDERYEIVEPIGYGGMGIVFRALHVELNRRVALKILSPEHVSDPVALSRFRREARALGAISHPNAVNVIDFGVTEDGLAFLVMELLEGRTLREVIAEAPIQLTRVARIASQICGAVTEAHRCGVIHRDLKPDNIMLVGPDGEGETAKVLDFGIAKLRSSNRLSGQLTAHDTVVGTPHYMAPEACERGEFTPSTDVYALGIILYEMLAGHPPFDGRNALDVAVRQVNDPPPPLAMHRSGIPAEVEAVVMRSLAKQPGERPDSAVALANDLGAAVRSAHERGLQVPKPRDAVAHPFARLPVDPAYPVAAGPSPERADESAIDGDAQDAPPRLSRRLVVGLLVAGSLIGVALVALLAHTFLDATTDPVPKRELNIELPQNALPSGFRLLASTQTYECSRISCKL